MLMRGDAVGVTLSNEHGLRAADLLPCQIQPIDQLALREDRRIGRVDVLGGVARIGRGQDSASEGNRAILGVADGEHQPATKSVVEARAFAAGKHQAGGFQQFRVKARVSGPSEEKIPRRGATANAKPFDHLVRNAAIGKVLAGCGGVR